VITDLGGLRRPDGINVRAITVLLARGLAAVIAGCSSYGYLGNLSRVSKVDMIVPAWADQDRARLY